MALTAHETRTVSFTMTGVLPAAVRLSLTWQRLCLAVVLALSAALEFIGLSDEGYANSYYAAGVKSMLTSWHNFFFVSYDSGGFVTLDKPPLGLWIEAASARIFGFSGLSLLVPEALAGVLSVALLYRLVTRVFDPAAGLLAALILALTPISAVIDRNNTIDSLLILTLLLGAWAVSIATERASLHWLLLAAVLVGLGFNIKMLQAYLVVPAFGLMYLLGAQIGWRARLTHLLLAAVVLLVVSFAWVAAVDLTPVTQRPFISDSGTNSELSLVLGYNGLGRLTQALFPGVRYLHIFGETIDLSIVPGNSPGIGNPGLFRLFSPEVGGQVSWFLLPALTGLLAMLRVGRPRLPLGRQGQALVLWGGWLLAAGVFFSTARFFHLYYLMMLAPAIAALAGAGLVALWREYRQPAVKPLWKGWRAWLLPMTLLGSAVLQVHLLDGYPSGSAWPAVLLIAGTLVIAALLVAPLLRIELLISPEITLRTTPRIALCAAAIAICGLLVAPAAWAVIAISDGQGGAWLPQAGPASSGGFGGGGFGGRGFGGGAGQNGFRFPNPSSGTTAGTGQGISTPGSAGSTTAGGTTRTFPRGGFGGGGFGGGGALTFAGNGIPTLDAGLIRYLEQHQGKATYLVGTTTASYASVFILQTKQPAMAIGGYQGWDRILTLAKLKQMIAQGTIRYFYLSGSSGGGNAGFFASAGTARNGAASQNLATTNNDLTNWVQTSCAAVSTKTWQATGSKTSTTATFGRGGGLQLYDCAAQGHSG